MSINHTTYTKSSGFCKHPTYFLDQRSLLARSNKNESLQAWSDRLGKCMAQPESKMLLEWNALLEIVKTSHLVVVAFTEEEGYTLAFWLHAAAGLNQGPAAPAATEAKPAPAKPVKARKPRKTATKAAA